MSPEEQTFISALRFRMAPGATEPPTLDEMKKAILILRGSRRAASDANAASTSGKKAKSAPTQAAISSALDELDNF